MTFHSAFENRHGSRATKTSQINNHMDSLKRQMCSRGAGIGSVLPRKHRSGMDLGKK